MPNPTGWVDPFGLSSKEYETGNPNKEGTATINKHQPTPENQFGHYSIEVNANGKSVSTHQVITARDESATTIVSAIEYPPSKSVVQSKTVSLPNPEAALDYQKTMEMQELGPYSKKNNSCVTHVCEVLRQGGTNVPNSALGEYKYLKKLGF